MELVLTGIFIGFFIAISGMGGGALTTPILLLFFNVPISIAVGTSLAFSFITKVFASFLYIKKGFYCKKLVSFLLVGSIPGVITGSYALHIITDKYPLFAKLFIPIIIALLIFISSFYSIYKIIKNENYSKFDLSEKKYLIPIIGFFVGFDVGFTSIGAGVITGAILLAFCSLPASRIVGTDILHGLFLSLIGSSVHFYLGHTEFSLLLPLTIGGVIGVFTGAFVLPYLPNKQLKLGLNLGILILTVFFLKKFVN